MKVFLLLAALFASVLSNPVSQHMYSQEDEEKMASYLVEGNPEIVDIDDIDIAERNLRIQETDLTYHFFNQRRPEGIKVRISNTALLQSAGFNRLLDTMFIIHGWNGHNESSSNYNIREAILARNNINVFVVDWSLAAGGSYISAQGSVLRVGQHLASFIRNLAATQSLDISTVSFVGFSLGAHVAGNAGAALNAQVDHIVGLDPAGPLFSVSNTDNRLDPTDAQFVQVIHTNGGLLGYSRPCGHADYYPNGGSSQPGCGLDLIGSCAHSRAYAYYSESILANNNLFVARTCGSQRDYDRGNCGSNPSSVMGGNTLDTRASGDYYLNTNSAAPFARG